MSKNIVPLIVIVGFVITIFAFLSMIKDDLPTETEVEQPTTYKILYTNGGYVPTILTVPVGATVIWENQSLQEMWPATDPHPGHHEYPDGSAGYCDDNPSGEYFDACEVIPTGGTYSFTFLQEGEWGYHNHELSRHKGKIVVYSQEDPSTLQETTDIPSNIGAISGNYEIIAEWGGFGGPEEDGKFQLPYGSVIHTDDHGQEVILITDCHNNNIQTFDLNGNFLSKFGREGVEPGLLDTPSAIDIDLEGNIWVVEHKNNRVSQFDTHGNFLEVFDAREAGDQLLQGILGVAFNSKGDMYLTLSRKHLVMKVHGGNDTISFLNSNTVSLAEGAEYGTKEGEFRNPYYLAVDSKDNVYVVDQSNNRIQKFNSQGEFLLMWGSQGSEEGQFHHPHEIAIDKHDNVYIADLYNRRIQVFDSEGSFLTQFGNEEVFTSPKTVAVDSNLNVYVGDIGPTGEDDTPHEHQGGPKEVKITKWEPVDA